MPIRKFKAQIHGYADFLRDKKGAIKYLKTTQSGDPSTAARKALSPLTPHGIEYGIDISLFEVETGYTYSYKIWIDDDGIFRFINK